MPQKKIARRTKTKKSAAKPQMQRGILALAEKVEKEFRQIPAKLSALYRQELKVQKQLESKLKTEIKKATALQKKTLKKQARLMKAKVVKSTQKQLTKLQKLSEQTTKTIKMLTTKWDQVKKTTEMLLGKQKKYVSFKKGLAQLEKQFSLNNTAKKAKPSTLKKTKSSKSKLAKHHEQPSAKENTMSEETPFMISSKTEIVEM